MAARKAKTEVEHDEGSLDGDAGVLYRQSWRPSREARAVVAIVHGYAEHSGRYDWVGNQLAAAGFAVDALDLRGHGRSAGPRVLVREMREYIADVAVFLRSCCEGYPGKPLFLLGHSMGGLIAAYYTASRRPGIAGLILSGPAVTPPSRTTRALAGVVGLVARVKPDLGVRTLEASTVSRDPAVVAAYDADPLVYRGKMPAATLAALLGASARLARHVNRITVPLYIAHGMADELCEPRGSRRLARLSRSKDKTVHFYPELAHEVFNEPEKEQVLSDLRTWLEART